MFSYLFLKIGQTFAVLAVTCSKLTIEAIEQGVKYVHTLGSFLLILAKWPSIKFAGSFIIFSRIPYGPGYQRKLRNLAFFKVIFIVVRLFLAQISRLIFDMEA